MKTILKIDGMTCGHCVKHVKEALEELAGVKSATVNLEQKNAEVEHEENVSLEAMKEAVTEVGYEVVS